MKKILLFIGLTLTFAADAKQATQSDEAIKKEIIQQSIQAYSGNCPCTLQYCKKWKSVW